MAASATFALKAGVWFRRGRRCMISPESQATSVPAVRQKFHLSPCPKFRDQLFDHLHNEARQMLLRKPLVHGGRQQESSLPINRAEVIHQKAALVMRESIRRF